MPPSNRRASIKASSAILLKYIYRRLVCNPRR
jgi:hypothetical protein